MVLTTTELAGIDALRYAGADPERIADLVDELVRKGIEDGRYTETEAWADVDVSMRLAEALLGSNYYGAFLRARMHLDIIREEAKVGPEAGRWCELACAAALLCGNASEALGCAVAGLCTPNPSAALHFLLGILRARFGNVEEGLDVLRRGLALYPDDAVLKHALKEVAEGSSLQDILASRPLWKGQSADIDRTAPGSDERLLRLSCVETDPDGYADACIALDVPALEPFEETPGFLTMTAKTAGRDVPLVFEMNEAGLSKMNPAWLARIAQSVEGVLQNSGTPAHRLAAVHVRLDRSLRVELEKPSPAEQAAGEKLAAAIDYSFEVPVRCPGLEPMPECTAEELAIMKHLRALDLRCDCAGIIERIRQIPHEKFTTLYGFEYARAIANNPDSKKEDYEQALSFIRDSAAWGTKHYAWHFCHAFLNLMLDKKPEALAAFEICANMHPDDRAVRLLTEACRRGLSVPVFEKPFRVRVKEVWAAIEAESEKLEQLFSEIAGPEAVRSRLEVLMAPVAGPWWKIDVYARRGRIMIEISPHGWRLECFPILEFIRHMPESLKEHWDVNPGRMQRPNVAEMTFSAGGFMIPASDIRIWPQHAEGMWKLMVYVENSASFDEPAFFECFHAVRTLIDRAVGEAARLRWADSISLCRAAPEGTGLTLLEFADFLRENAPDSVHETLENYALMPHEYRMRPDRSPDAPLLADVRKGVTLCPPLGYLYSQKKTVGMDALASVGATAGFIFFEVNEESSDGASKEARRKAAREALQAHLLMTCPDCIDFVGVAEGTRYEYLQFFSWDIQPVIAAAAEFFGTLDDVLEAGFHTYLRDASSTMLKVRSKIEDESVCEETPAVENEESAPAESLEAPNLRMMQAAKA